MKKQINILSVLLLVFLLSSCFTSKDDIDQAKKNLWIIETENSINTSWNEPEIKEDNSKDKVIVNNTENKIVEEEIIEEEIVEEVKEEKIIINSLTENQFLELDDLSWKDLLWWEVEITWKTKISVDRIVVTFANHSSEFPVDKYELKQFESGDETFLYRAFSRYETLDFWKNVYVFEAFSWEQSSKLELILNVIEEEEVKVSEKTEKIYEDIAVWELPSNEKFWTPIDLGNWKISYSDLNGLEIKRDINPKLVCEKVTSVLADKLSGWFFWNTCRPIEEDEWISFFVIRLDWDDYIYEKHYYLSYSGLYWIQELEKWTWVTSADIWEKNSELKEKNDDYAILEITDELFKEILK